MRFGIDSSAGGTTAEDAYPEANRFVRQHFTGGVARHRLVLESPRCLGDRVQSYQAKQDEGYNCFHFSWFLSEKFTTFFANNQVFRKIVPTIKTYHIMIITKYHHSGRGIKGLHLKYPPVLVTPQILLILRITK